MLKSIFSRDAFDDYLAAEEGITALEYGLLAGLITVGIVGLLQGSGGIGDRLVGVFTQIRNALPTAATP